jgi:hypothetical protein
MKKFLLLTVGLIALLALAQSQNIKINLPSFNKPQSVIKESTGKQVLVEEESTVIKAIEKSIPSVVTV